MFIKIIERKKIDNSDMKEKSVERNQDSSSKDNPLPSSITELMRPKSKLSKKDYYNKHKYHFNRKLSEYVVNGLIFIDTATKAIPFEKCLDLMKGNNIKLPEEATEGDLHYVINKIRSEHSLETVKTDIHALKLAIECLENPNREEGDIFLEWLESTYRKNKDVIWEKFVE